MLSQVGLDATGAFEVFHPSEVNETLANYYVGDLAEPSKNNSKEFRKDVDLLTIEFEKEGLFVSNKLYYVFKVVSTTSICFMSIFVLHYFEQSILSTLFSALIMAIFWQQCGWLAHDFLHHQVFENRAYNDAMGLIVGNIFQGFSVSWWKDKHCTHHSSPNVHNVDTDIDTMPFLAWY